jgi:cell division initiation protein
VGWTHPAVTLETARQNPRAQADAVPMMPEEIDPGLLPRASVGGFKPGPVHELLKRVAWDYRQLVHDNKQLQTQLTELQERAEGFERQLEALHDRKPPDELARQALAASQRAARELRESTRRQCEVALKKARRRANRIDRDKARAEAELRELQKLRRTARERLRSSLNAALQQVEDPQPTAALDTDLLGQLDAAESAPRAGGQEHEGQTQRV